MENKTRIELGEVTDLLNSYFEPGPLKHTPEDDTVRQCLMALIEIEQESDEFILEVCEEIRWKLESIGLLSRDTIPAPPPSAI